METKTELILYCLYYRPYICEVARNPATNSCWCFSLAFYMYSFFENTIETHINSTQGSRMTRDGYVEKDILFFTCHFTSLTYSTDIDIESVVKGCFDVHPAIHTSFSGHFSFELLSVCVSCSHGLWWALNFYTWALKWKPSDSTMHMCSTGPQCGLCVAG